MKKNKTNQKFVIFLDVDGVLNSKTTVKQTPMGYRGIDGARVKMLADAISKYGGGKIVLSSDWKELKPDEEDYVYLSSKLEKYGLKISGKTVDCRHNGRGSGILNYMEEHSEIEEFVILDDNLFDFQDSQKLWERLLLTNGLEFAKFASRTPAVETMVFLECLKSC